jgi:serine protease Do
MRAAEFSPRKELPMPFDSSQAKTRMPRALFAALLLSAAIGGGGVAYAVSGQSVPPPLGVTVTNPQPGFSPLVSKVKPAVVQIATVLPGKSEDSDGDGAQMQEQGPMGDMLRQFGMRGGMRNGQGMHAPEQHASGSGFIIDPTGYIVTNNHVVDGASTVSVTLTDGNKYTAKVVGHDAKTDLALLKINAGHTLPYVAFGDSDNAHEGDWVIAVGNPYGLGGTVTAGIVSAHGRDINEGPYDDFMQIDAPINPGNSGGPLFNQSGQVVGIDTAIYSPTGGSVGIGFAIPSNVAKSIIPQLRDHGKVARGWLGIAMQPMTQTLAKAVGLPNADGVLVNSVQQGSPAARSTLKQGDVITAYDGKPVRTTRDLALAVANTPDGRSANLTVWRDSHAQQVAVTITSQDQQKEASAADSSAAPGKVGMSLAALTPDARDQLGVAPSVNGVVVADVTDGSRADQSGLQAGDVIERVAGSAVSTPQQVAAAINTAEQQKKDAIPLLVSRNGQAAYVGLQLAEG